MKLDYIIEVVYKPRGERGEDAFAYDFSRNDINAMAVFDGCGGAGAWQYSEFCNATGAFVAAQTIAKEYLNWVRTVSLTDVENPNRLADSFYSRTQSVLRSCKSRCKPMGVSGSLVKAFPCTATSAIVTKYNETSIRLTALNVGDSRVYYLTPSEGLIQLTQDDARGKPDPLTSLRNGAPLSNLLNADKPYQVRTVQVTISEPCIVLCATDGVFGFVRSPMDFEYMLLQTIMSSDNAVDFEKCFRDEIIRLTGDDSTCLMAFYGGENYSEVKKRLRKRYSDMQKMILSINSAKNPVEVDELILQYWNLYKKKTVYSEMQG